MLTVSAKIVEKYGTNNEWMDVLFGKIIPFA